MKNAIFWDVEPCRSCVNRRFGGTYRLDHQGRKIREQGTSRLVTQSAATCSLWCLVRGFFCTEIEMIRSSETAVHTRSTRRHIPEDDNLHSHRCENLESYIGKNPVSEKLYALECRKMANVQKPSTPSSGHLKFRRCFIICSFHEIM
jgi:hypothetical protein